MGKAVSKRYLITLPDGIAADLDRWAEAEGNKPTSLAGSLIEQGVRQAKIDGLIPEDTEKGKTRK